jgi:hypothetical protein
VAERFVTMLRVRAPRVVPEYGGQMGGDRNQRRGLSTANWHIDPGQLDGAQRVLILDDTWVTGGHVQSLAGAFEGIGVRARAMVLGRAIDPGRIDHGTYLHDFDPTPFDASVCPVHRVRHTA